MAEVDLLPTDSRSHHRFQVFELHHRCGRRPYVYFDEPRFRRCGALSAPSPTQVVERSKNQLFLHFRLHGKAIVSRPARVNKFKFNVFSHTVKMAVVPNFLRLVRFNPIWRTKRNVNSSSVCLPAWQLVWEFFVSIGYPLVMSLFETVVQGPWVRGVSGPKLSDELVSFYVCCQMEK